VRYPEFHYRREFDLRSSPEAIWPLVSDTNRFNRDTGVPAVNRVHDASLHNARQRLRLTRFGVPIEWEEEPFEWVRPSRFGVRRRYRTGPVAEMRILAEVSPRGAGGSHLVYQVWARARGALGLLAIPAQVGILSRRTFRRAFRRYDAMAAASGRRIEVRVAHLTESGRERQTKLTKELLAEGASAELVGRLAETIEHADELEVSRLRPYALADAWGAPRREVLELCLLATRLGLLELRWDVMCPLCRGAKQTFSSLDELESQVHCDVCQIDFAVNLDRFVEVTFRPNAAVRDVDVGEYCVGGPQVTPHIIMQQLVQPGQERSLTVPLEAGRYRVRTLGLPAGQLLAAVQDGDESHSFTADPSGWPEGEPRLSLAPSLCLRNATAHEQLFILERMAWTDQAATAAEVTVLQCFRDLFSREAVRPGQPISVGSLAILFTDLRGSTRLYRQIGDAPAFGLVMDHFDVLRHAVTAEGGTIVKTIGDAVMATFLHPAPALRAILAARASLKSRNSDVPIVVKAGIHYGPSIAVTLNDRLDYFGSSVNVAARLEGLSRGDDVVVSSAVRNDSEVEALLSDPSRHLGAEPMEGTLKGLEEEPIAMWRISGQEASYESKPSFFWRKET
jgi:class 3 adenylate cyclase